MIKEFCNKIKGKSSCDDCDNCPIGEIIKEHDEQIIAEAIKEFAKWEDDNCINYYEFDNHEDVVKRYLEQIKEHRNE